MWKCDKYNIKDWKLIVIAKHLKSWKTRNATWPWINLNFDLLREDKDFDSKFIEIINECLISWDWKESIAKKLKTLLNKYFWYKQEEIIIDVESLFIDNSSKLNLEINFTVFEYFKDFFESYDSFHKSLLDKGMELFDLYSKDSYFEDVIDKIHFSGWTSLLYKYKDFYRFSKDLDFQYFQDVSLDEEFKIRDLFSRIKTWLFNYLISFDWIMIEDETWIHKEIYFIWNDKKRRNIKIDFMKFPGVAFEILNVNWLTINKLSDLDILCNKLFRLKEVDICDITFLIIKNNFSKKDIYDTIQKKSQEFYKEEFEFFTAKQQLWKDNIQFLPFLKQFIF